MPATKSILPSPPVPQLAPVSRDSIGKFSNPACFPWRSPSKEGKRQHSRMSIFRVFVHKRPEFALQEEALLEDLQHQLQIDGLTGLRLYQRYDVGGIESEAWERAKIQILAEPQVDTLVEVLPQAGTTFAVEYLPGQFDQRADSAEQCIRIASPGTHPIVKHALVYQLEGELTEEAVQAIKAYLINPVDSREASLAPRDSLESELPPPAPVKRLDGFRAASKDELNNLGKELGLAMSLADLQFCQAYFRDTEERAPSITEIRMLDTYWSDHCRHTTFLTELKEVTFEDSEATLPFQAAWNRYQTLRTELYGDRCAEKSASLMDIATIGMKALRKAGKLEDLEESEEINAASLYIPVQFEDGTSEEWLLMFKNETHNHPTEIEPFGGAATCLGGAIRDPLSGRSYVYQAMRVTGSGDPRTPIHETLEGKLPQRVITREAARGYSSYGNQIGLATGIVNEVYHPGYVAKRMEIGAVVGAAPKSWVRRDQPEPGDRIVLVGGKTGRDGIGGATGSSKEHTTAALENTAEVQKGNPPIERALQRLFRKQEVATLIKRCNDFGAGGVSVAIGELAPSLLIHLDRVPKKYEGLDGTELAISESQERMAVVLSADDVDRFIAEAANENLEAVEIAEVTDSGRLQMEWQGDQIVDLDRSFLDSNGVRQEADAHILPPAWSNPATLPYDSPDFEAGWLANLSQLNVCSQKGLVERFDSTIGAGSVCHPFGGTHRLTPTEAMVAKIPSMEGETVTASIMSWGFDPALSSQCPFHGAMDAVVQSVSRIVAAGGDYTRVRLTLQEYFERLRGEPIRWGKPLLALLGALEAQLELGTPAIGGKDSMSGSFNDLDVPPTLVSFAITTGEVEDIVTPEFKSEGSTLTLLLPRRKEDRSPDWESLRSLFEYVHLQSQAGQLLSISTIGPGGTAAALTKASLGNYIGVQIPEGLSGVPWFHPAYGAFLVESDQPLPASSDFQHLPLGHTIPRPWIEIGSVRMELEDLEKIWTGPLESTFPTQASTPQGEPRSFAFGASTNPKASRSIASPRATIPAFPGTNCEWDSARAIRLAGGVPDIQVFRNQTLSDIEDSLEALESSIRNAQILFLPGGFSAGDEPEGSGKFIATVLRNPRIADAVMDLIRNRDGLILGICNGFQALVKLGLLPFGEIREMEPTDPTLTFNRIGRHVSCYVTTRVASTLSPWLGLSEPGDLHTIPVSHGEGNFVASEAVVDQLAAAGQIATQYVDNDGQPSYDLSVNPNGSIHCIEGITSADGRIFGKMGHSERVGHHIGINIPGNLDQAIFKAGVNYFA